MYFAVEAVSHPHLSARSFENDLNPVALHHFVTETWQRGDLDVDAFISYLGFHGL
jgi:hypothetical protein